MKLLKIIDLANEDRFVQMGVVPEKRAAAIIREALARIAREIAAVEDDVVKIPGFGNFRIRQAQVLKDGQKTTVRRVVFNLPKGGSADKNANAAPVSAGAPDDARKDSDKAAAAERTVIAEQEVEAPAGETPRAPKKRRRKKTSENPPQENQDKEKSRDLF